jgi:hypothetical protein
MKVRSNVPSDSGASVGITDTEISTRLIHAVLVISASGDAR